MTRRQRQVSRVMSRKIVSFIRKHVGQVLSLALLEETFNVDGGWLRARIRQWRAPGGVFGALLVPIRAENDPHDKVVSICLSPRDWQLYQAEGQRRAEVIIREADRLVDLDGVAALTTGTRLDLDQPAILRLSARTESA